MKLIKFNTSVVKVTHKNADTVSYINYTDLHSRNLKHFIPSAAAFPYKRLEIGLTYTLISALIEAEPRPQWCFWRAWQLDQVEDGALVDEQLEKLISEMPEFSNA